MGQFESGKWLIGLAIYFFMFTFIVFAVLSAQAQQGVDIDSHHVTDVGFLNPDNNSVSGSVTTTDTVTWDNVKKTFTFMAGFNAIIDMPGTFYFIISFIFFWIPFVMLLWSIYMAIPFFH